MQVKSFADSIKDCGQNLLNFQKQANFEEFTGFYLLFHIILYHEALDL